MNLLHTSASDCVFITKRNKWVSNPYGCGEWEKKNNLPNVKWAYAATILSLPIFRQTDKTNLRGGNVWSLQWGHFWNSMLLLKTVMQIVISWILQRVKQQTKVPWIVKYWCSIYPDDIRTILDLQEGKRKAIPCSET